MEKACSICSHPCITACTGPTTFDMLAGLIMKPSSIRGRRGSRKRRKRNKISEKKLRRRKSRKIEKEQQ